MKWISWLLDHLWAAVVIVGVLAQLFQAVFKRKNEGMPGSDAGEEPARDSDFGDPDLAEQTRRIREDIERRKAQRAGQQAEERVEQSQPNPSPVPPLVREVTKSPTPARESTRVEARRQAEILEEQASLLEKLQEAEVLKAAAARRRGFELATADHATEVRAATRLTVLEDLHSPAALRRAFILREVLGPPLALRPDRPTSVTPG
ncbi:MAG TPA: hypothetical protein VG734_01980 [Lacunisphaera sp.]|nr:hypothetical protein [Lacunisphaera sp.]